MDLRPIFNIAEITHRLGAENVVLSPGSRSAPLTLAFSRNKNLKSYVINDERSAAFIAMGMSLGSSKPVVLACTSGTAVYNYAPAIAEAFFQQVPLIIMTADRPPEWVGQEDGQTIFQTGIYGKHVKKSFEYPVDTAHKDAELHGYRIISEAFQLACEWPRGPVHINFPFREPFYPAKGEKITADSDVPVIQTEYSDPDLSPSSWEKFRDLWLESGNILIAGGQYAKGKETTKLLSALSTEHHIPVCGDVISNLHEVEGIINLADVFLGGLADDKSSGLQPDLLITFGQSTISKSLKLYFRKNKPRQHWHIQPSGSAHDTFQTLTDVLHTTPERLLSKALEWKRDDEFIIRKQENFHELWSIAQRNAERLIDTFFSKGNWGEFEAARELVKSIPGGSSLHLANSMPVRLANFSGIHETGDVKVFANRGTSGIDGSNGTAAGVALVDRSMNILLTGDMAFFYDRNAFWHKYDLSNLRILVLNNHAGGIFGMIDGPSDQPELKEYFETDQFLTAESTAREFGFDYFHCTDKKGFTDALPKFLSENKKPVILEVETGNEENKKIYREFKKYIRKEL